MPSDLIAVVGIGRIGLPLAARLASLGNTVTGCDIRADLVDAVNRGLNPIPDEEGLGPLLAEVVAAGSLRATTDTLSAAREASTLLFAVAVDVGEDDRADLEALRSAAEAIAPSLTGSGKLCIFDTTLPVGTTRQVLAPLLESHGAKAGRDFHVAFSPERLLMGRVLEDLGKYPKVVGGLDPEAGRRAAQFYRDALPVPVIELQSAEAAELTKIAEGVYRDLNIALANELALTADVHGVDVQEVIAAANTQPYCHIHVPGTGVGGHCIPVYPRFLMQGPGPSSLAALGRQVNDSMPAHAARLVAEELGSLQGKRVLILGLTFRPNVAVVHHTNAVDLLRELTALGATVHGHDPLLTADGIRSLGFEPASESPTGYDVAIVHAYHEAYATLDWGPIAPLILDARNAMDRAALESAGLRYLGIGRPPTPR